MAILAGFPIIDLAPAWEALVGNGSPVARPFATGSRVAGYVLEQEIGQGGMAVVYRAHDERLGRTVALKVLAPALAADEAYQKRFIRESRAAAAVDDPHIVPVFEAGQANGLSFIAMRFVRGGDVRSLVHRHGPLPAGRAAELVSQIASALDAAHRHGLVHRDVKPANILLDADEESGRPDHAYLSDFGLSKDPLAPGKLTGTGQFVGTLDYTSPEQLSGRQVDARTDQYALACTAFELLTGAPPFERGVGVAVMYAHLSEPAPSLSSRRPDLPPGSDEVFARALAKAPADRYGTCGEFAEALRGVLGLAPYRAAAQQARPPGSAPRPSESAPTALTGGDTIGSPVPAPALTGSDTIGSPVPAPALTGGDTIGSPATTPEVTGARPAGDKSRAPARPDRPTRPTRPARTARRWAVATGAAAVALAAVGGYLLLGGGAPAAAPNVIFRSDFAHGAAGWTVLPDAADGRFRSGAYEISAHASGNIEIAFPPPAAGLARASRSALRVSVVARSTGSPVQDTQYGITCRSDDQGNRYLFSVKGTTALIVKSTHAGGQYLYQPLTHATAAPITAGSAIRLQADCIDLGGQALRLVFWVNGRKLLDVTDNDPLTSGTVGLFTNFFARNVDTADARFREFAVSRL